MSEIKIPYVFLPIPYEFFSDEFLDDPIMMRIIRYIMKRISPNRNSWSFKNNGRMRKVDLESFEFVFGRDACAKECAITPKNVQTRMDQLIGLSFVEKVVSRSASTYSVYRLLTTSFRKNGGQQSGQLSGQQSGQQSGHKQETREQENKETRIQTTRLNPQIEKDVVVCFDSSSKKWVKQEEEISIPRPIIFVSNTDCNEKTNKVSDLVQEKKQNKLQENKNETKNDYSFLDGLIIKQKGMTENEKQNLIRLYPIERIKLAVAYVSNPSVIIQTTLIQILSWHCKQDKPILSKEQLQKQNEKFMRENDKTALEFFNQCQPIAKEKFYVSDKEKYVLKIGEIDRPLKEISIFESPLIFRNLLESALRDFGIWRPKNEKIEPLPMEEIAMEN